MRRLRASGGRCSGRPSRRSPPRSAPLRAGRLGGPRLTSDNKDGGGEQQLLGRRAGAMGGVGAEGEAVGARPRFPGSFPLSLPAGFWGSPQGCDLSSSDPPPADLRKQARQLENELDLKLVSFSKLCTSYSGGRDGRRDRYRY